MAKDPAKVRVKFARGDAYGMVLQQQLRHFPEAIPEEPRDLPAGELARRAAFLAEEAMEYLTAETLAERLDALVDLVVVALGAAAFHGFHRFDEALERVVDANLLKRRGLTGTRGTWGFDLEKPEGWEPPDLRDLVGEVANLEERDPGEKTPGVEYDFVERRAVDVAAHEAFHAAGCLRITPRFVIEELRRKGVDPAVIAHLRLLPKLQRAALAIDAEAPRVHEEFSASYEDPFLPSDPGAEVRAGRHRVPGIDRLDQVHPQLLKAAALLVKKGEDYGDQDFAKSNYHPFGDASYLQMLHNKLERAKTLAGFGPDGERREEPNFDSQRDTVVDLINYAAFYAQWLEERERVAREAEK